VQAARDSARRVQCLNNLKQMALGCLAHHSKYEWFPTGGWGWGWAGDPDRGYTFKQPGGWIYNILAFVEQEPLHELGHNGNRAETRRCLETALALVSCPSRRRCIAYPYVHGSNYANADYPSAIGRSDYAACGGDMRGSTFEYGPGSLTEGDSWSEAKWDSWHGTHNDATGVVYRRSQVRTVPDGDSNTYLCGERYLNPDYYTTGNLCANDQGWNLGYDFDIMRWTYPDTDHKPMQDTPGLNSNGGCDVNFGSAHYAMFNMALCDGSVHAVSYDIDQELHRRLGNRKDGLPVVLTKILR
jgi:hypothetical protein